MIEFDITINHGDADIEKQYQFIHKDWKNLPESEQRLQFRAAKNELDYVYKTYGRFATQVGIIKLFEHFGFIQLEEAN